MQRGNSDLIFSKCIYYYDLLSSLLSLQFFLFLTESLDRRPELLVFTCKVCLIFTLQHYGSQKTVIKDDWYLVTVFQ